METPDPPFMTPLEVSKPPVLRPQDIPRILRPQVKQPQFQSPPGPKSQEARLLEPWRARYSKTTKKQIEWGGIYGINKYIYIYIYLQYMWWYDMISYDMNWYDMIWYDMIRIDMIWYDVIWYDVIWYDVIWYDMIWYQIYDMIWYDIKYMIWIDMISNIWYELI